MSYRIEADFSLKSEWLPADAFTRHYAERPAAVATAIEGLDDPKEQEVRLSVSKQAGSSGDRPKSGMTDTPCN